MNPSFNWEAFGPQSLIRAEDLRSIPVVIRLETSATAAQTPAPRPRAKTRAPGRPAKIDLRDLPGPAVFGPENAQAPAISLLQLDGQEVVLETNTGLAAFGHHLKLTIEAGEPPLRFSSTAKVVGRDPLSATRDRVDLVLIQYDNASLERLTELFTRRQRQIQDFLRSARGC